MNSIIFFTISLVIINQIYGHSYVTTPITRTNQRQSTTGCRDDCGPCDGTTTATVGDPVVTANVGTTMRGAVIPITWPRNNHAGGFVRYSWAPSSQSNSQAAFDAGIDTYWCFEIPGSTCHSDPADGPNGNDPANSSQFICGNSITVPNFVADGAWTLQWIWYGGIYNLGEYRSCVDYIVSGGTTYSATIPIPVYHGGDVGNTGQECKFANTNTAHTCSEPCEGPWLPSGAEQNGPPNATYVGSISNPTTSVSATSTATGTATASATTGQPPYTTGMPYTPYTTGMPYTPPYTTGSPYTTESAPRITTSPNDFALIEGPSQGMCPNPSAPNIDGDILFPPVCGTSYPNSRCPDGQCCSQSGSCGPVPSADGEYRLNVGGVIEVVTYQEAFTSFCQNNQGSWAYVACTSDSTILAISIISMTIAALLAF